MEPVLLIGYDLRVKVYRLLSDTDSATHEVKLLIGSTEVASVVTRIEDDIVRPSVLPAVVFEALKKMLAT